MPLCPSELSLSPPTTQLFRPRAARAYTGPSWMQSYYSMSWVRPSWKYELKDSWQVTSWQQEALKQICGVWRPHCRRRPSCSPAPVRFWFLRGSAYAYTRSSLPELVWLVSFSGKQKKKKTLLKTSALCSFHGVTGNKLLTKPQGCRQRWKQNTTPPGPHPQPPAHGHSLLLVRKIIKRHKLLKERLTLPGNSQKQPRASSQSEKLLEQFGYDNNYFTVTIHRLGCWRIYLLMLGNFFFF